MFGFAASASPFLLRVATLLANNREIKGNGMGLDIGVRQDSFHATLTGTPHASICLCRKSIKISPHYSLLSSSSVCGERGATPAHTHQYILIKNSLYHYISYYPILITSLYNYMLLSLFRIFPHTITSFNM